MSGRPKLIGPAFFYVDDDDVVYIPEHNGGMISILTFDGERLARWGDGPVNRSCHGIWVRLAPATSTSCSLASGDACGASSDTTGNRQRRAGRPAQAAAGRDCVTRQFTTTARSGGKCDRRRGAGADRALQFDRPVMQLHDPLDRGQAETGALMAPAQ